MAIYPQEFLDKVKDRTDIVDLISEYIPTEKKGRDYWARCPFHKEKTPSFQIKREQQFYKCYGCNKMGNVYTFLMDYQKMTFGEAVEFLANKAHIELPEQVVDKEYLAKKDLMQKIFEINRLSAQFYHNNLRTAEGVKALEYLTDRGITNDTIIKFGIGCSTDYDSLPKYLLSKGYTLANLHKAGVVGVGENTAKPYDFFAMRLTIPIINGNGKVIGFTARVLEKKADFAKYKNTPSTLAFDKRKNLFNINMFKKLPYASVKSMILVEGHMDVIMMYQEGICNVVASMGTSLTIEQCKEIKRYADIVYVSFDGDSAGQNATLRGLDLLREQGLEVKVVCLTDGFDPDDYIRKFGKDGYMELVDKSLPLVDFKLKKVEEKYDLNSYDDRNKYAKEAISILSALDDVEKSIYVDLVSKKCGISKESLLDDKVMDRLTVVNKPIEEEENTEIASKAIMIASRFVLSSIINEEDYVDIRELDEAIFVDERHKTVYQYIVECIGKAKRPNMGDIFNILENNTECANIVNVTDAVPKENYAIFYNDSIKKLKQEYILRERKTLIEKLKVATDENIKEKIKKQILALR